MSTLLQYRTDLDTMLSSANLSDFFDDAMKKQWINLAGRRVCNFTSWDWLNHALTTESELKEWYVTPLAFKKNSIFRITMDDSSGAEQEYDIVPWNLYKEHRDNTTGKKVSALLKNQYFIYPTPTVIGLNIGVYGQLKWSDLSADIDDSIVPDDYDEAVEKLALAEALRKESRFDEANTLVNEVTQEILPRLADNQNKSAPKGFIGRSKTSRWDN